METVKKYYRADRKNISLIKFMIEACEGLAVLSTEDSQLGILKFSIAPGCVEEFNEVIEGLSREMRIEKWCQGEQASSIKQDEVGS